MAYHDGSLTQAMRACTLVPGLMTPLEYRGRMLVEGCLVHSLPIREVRDRCDAQVLIAFNLGSPPVRAEEVTGSLRID